MKPIFIQVSMGQGMQFINLSAVLYFEATPDRHVNVYFEPGKPLTVNMEMKEFLEKVHRVL